MILFCLPYAGGTSIIYNGWRKYLDPFVQIEPIELRGRGKRFNERFYETLEEAVEDIFQNIKDKIVDDQYAIYGHSMGSLLAYELYYKISDENFRKPKHIFFSGYRPPSVIRKEKNIHELPNDDFIRAIISLGGTPKEVLESKELIELVIPILRSDFEILENYFYKKRENKIECDISILNGKGDDITLKEIAGWEKHGSKGVKIYNFEGNHFFINDNAQNITNIINHTLID